MTTYAIIDTLTGLQVGKATENRSAANRKAERMSLAYGSYRYIVRPILA